jgi:hypothetical protein
MISRAQQILIKRAQREAGLDDAEYRDALQLAAGCRSTKDPAMTDRGVDLVLAYIEAIHWRKVDACELQPPCSAGAIFRQRLFWASRNPRQDTSRDRFNRSTIGADIESLESALGRLGFNAQYCAGIRARVTKGRNDAHGQYLYRTALRRTLAAKQKKLNGTALSAAPLER